MDCISEKILYMLIGPKGSGKTYIGTLLDRSGHIRFLSLEKIWLSLKNEENGWKKVEDSIDAEFEKHNRIMIENLGAGHGFTSLKNNLMGKYKVKLIKVKTSPDLCLKRVKERDNSDHIFIPEKKVVEYNKIASKVELDWDLVIENDPADDDYIIDKILTIIPS